MIIQNAPISMTELFELIGTPDDSGVGSRTLYARCNLILKYLYGTYGGPFNDFGISDTSLLTMESVGLLPELTSDMPVPTYIPYEESLQYKIRQLEEKINALGGESSNQGYAPGIKIFTENGTF